jgi:hypothetical protein
MLGYKFFEVFAFLWWKFPFTRDECGTIDFAILQVKGYFDFCSLVGSMYMHWQMLRSVELNNDP